ncbi:hypothetical protein MMC31_003358, partial [Peltigera leucophlebia]|nr:hypothetical protein [Peltigera leucophlebia]
MNPSHQNNRGQTNPTPSAEQPLASADVAKNLAEMKRVAADVSDFEIPRGSLPTPTLDRSRHRQNNPKIDPQQQLDPPPSPVASSLMAEDSSDGIELPVPQQQLDPSSVPLPPSSRLVASKLPSNAMDSTVAQPSATAIPPVTSYPRPLGSNMALPQPFTYLSGFDSMSPNLREIFQEAFNEGRSEGRRENQVKLDEAEAKIEELRKRLDPSKVKAAYNQGVLDGSITGYNKYSLNPELKQSDDRLAFEKILKQEIAAVKGQNDLMKAHLDNWQVQWGLITTNLEEWKAAFSTKASQLDSCQRELENSSRELRESKNKADRLVSAKAEEVGSLNASTVGLEGTETNGRQVLMDELENQDAQLYAAKKQIKELSQKLLAAPSQLSQSPPSASVSSPSHRASPASKPSSSPTISTSLAKGTTSSLRLRRLPATDAGAKFSLPRLLIIIFIFLLAILFPYLHSLSRQTNENTNSWEAINEVEVSGSREDRMRWEAWALDNLEQNEGSPSSQEDGWRRTEK